MFKLVKVTIRRGDFAKGENQMVYPSAYNSQEVDIMGLYATTLNIASISLSGGIGRGDDHEFCIIALPATLAAKYVVDPDMIIVSELVADNLMEQWRLDNNQSEEIVTDPERMLAITAKQGAGIVLAQEDLDALDVNSPVKGINKSRKSVREVLGTKLDA